MTWRATIGFRCAVPNLASASSATSLEEGPDGLANFPREGQRPCRLNDRQGLEASEQRLSYQPQRRHLEFLGEEAAKCRSVELGERIVLGATRSLRLQSVNADLGVMPGL